MDKRHARLLLCCAILVLPAAGCHRRTAHADADAPVAVGVSEPVQREVTDYVDFTGHVQAPFTVDVRPRVTGYLWEMPFREGAEVKVGDLLFEIDPRPYQALLESAQASVAVNTARLKVARLDNQRARELFKKSPGAISLEDLDRRQAAEEEAVGALAVANANVKTCQLNVDFTKIHSEIAGQISRYFYTKGNLVNQDVTTLTTVVSQDPMHVYFDLDEPTLLQILRWIRADKEAPKPLVERKVPVLIGLADEEGFPHGGIVDFANNTVDESTGTIPLRGLFKNPASESGARLLRPGMAVRVRLPMGRPHPALLVADNALQTEQDKKFLLTVDEHDVVQYRPVTTGMLQDDGLRVIREGLQPGERVITSGLQNARPRMTVQAENVPMPTTPARHKLEADKATGPAAPAAHNDK